MRDDFPTQLTFDDAQAIVDATAAEHRLPTERLALARTHQRILAQDVVAPIPLPPFDNSAMDGYAVRHADIARGETTLQLVGEQFAGRALDLRVDAGQCVRITTGAPMPAGADTVVIREVVRIEGDRITFPADFRAGANVRYAGEDVQVDDAVLAPGQVLTPARVATVASLGIDQLSVSARPTVAVFTTGDELVQPGIALEPGQIHDSNRELLMGLLRADGLEPTAWPTMPDDPERIASMLRDAASSFDVVITCGAVSAGEKDHVPALLDAHGRIRFWKVRMKPGMPLLFGDLDQARFLGLPGNPVSVFATYATLGRRLLDGLQGRTEARRVFRARLATPIDKPHARREFLRGRLEVGEDGTLRAHPDAATGSHRLRAAAMADALIVVPEGPQQLSIGSVVDVLPY
ncbi:gephyrin-like molybdotransferase Glp [Noviluteimonas gilva]|uniref:Molybdopterin molybdenumtransferase n=1 Tax=Noviluteimonas gilva TaxID=2682097 RepID=A0A7C9MMY7_9GAMM|nr:gephyrin-like molybdotransferase Glp [Lysobacter gilvus]MUV14847.1 molybdopterin molybdenumtransferase MoeA [Lysobacter gilvus]